MSDLINERLSGFILKNKLKYSLHLYTTKCHCPFFFYGDSSRFDWWFHRLWSLRTRINSVYYHVIFANNNDLSVYIVKHQIARSGNYRWFVCNDRWTFRTLSRENSFLEFTIAWKFCFRTKHDDRTLHVNYDQPCVRIKGCRVDQWNKVSCRFVKLTYHNSLSQFRGNKTTKHQLVLSESLIERLFQIYQKEYCIVMRYFHESDRRQGRFSNDSRRPCNWSA